EQLVELPFGLGIALPAGLGRLRLARPAPAPDADREQDSAPEDPAERQPPGEEVEALMRRRREDALPEVGHELVLDLLRAPALRDPSGDLRLDVLCRGRLRHVE